MRQPLCALLVFGHQRAGFTVVQHLYGKCVPAAVTTAAALVAASVATVEKGPCPCGHLLFLAPSLCMYHQGFRAFSYNYSWFLS